MVVPLYIGELAPAKYRGRMIAFNNMSVTFGQLIASAIGAGLAEVKREGWRGRPAHLMCMFGLRAASVPCPLVSQSKYKFQLCCSPTLACDIKLVLF